MSKKADRTPVRPGQVWESCDPRAKHSKILVQLVREDYGVVYGLSISNQKIRKIKITRFYSKTGRLNGYRIISDVE